MGSSDSAEITNLVGAYLLYCLNKEIPELQGGLYRDDALFIIPTNNKSTIERMRKNIGKFFKSFNLSITFEYGTKIVNFLDTTLNISSKLHYPYRKENEVTKYVNRSSNHPPNIFKSIVKTISDRLTKLSLNHDIFKSNSHYYNEALSRAGYDQKISFLIPKSIKCDSNNNDNNTNNDNLIILNNVTNHKNLINVNNDKKRPTNNNLSCSNKRNKNVIQPDKCLHNHINTNKIPSLRNYNKDHKN
ncbi:uncharacterized protein DDB_G0287625-like [Octopus bimaculoides]|uniref:uncharacterized protein DDB_G0287625-like n=1 Tax=Octopus bimaculoides TaxID=37653 RepID=UPI00071D9301|nr:uncharacterized protein DDB_G0287625-like [Octopus bimaculoides]|eukprot:XP_014783251.1 PREDICTED: uncharacterized protein DDB_G0287625-like [Octopus bimaculoides]